MKRLLFRLKLAALFLPLVVCMLVVALCEGAKWFNRSLACHWPDLQHFGRAFYNGERTPPAPPFVPRHKPHAPVFRCEYCNDAGCTICNGW